MSGRSIVPLLALTVGLIGLAIGVAAVSGPLGAYAVVFASFLSFILASVPEYREGDTPGSFFFGDFSISESQFLSTLAATNIPLVLGLLYFYSLGSLFGLTTVIIMVAISVLPFVFLAGIFGKDLGDLARERVTLHEFLGKAHPDYRFVRPTVAVISTVAFLLAVGFELRIGGGILGQMLGLPDRVALGVALGLALLTGLYTSLGGYRAAVRTDQVQYLLVVAGVVASLGLIWYAVPGVSTIVWTAPAEVAFAKWSVIFGSLVFYPVWYLCSMDTWQRAAASSNPHSQKSWQLLGMLMVLLVYGIVGFAGSLSGVRDQPGGIVALVGTWLLSPSAVVRMAAVLTLGGMIAAMASTIDTYSMMISQAIDVDIAGNDWRKPSGRGSWLRRFYAIAAPIVGVVVADVIVRAEVADALSLFYVAYAGQGALFVPIIVAIARRHRGDARVPEPRGVLRRSLSWVASASGSRTAAATIVGFVVAVATALTVRSDSVWLYMSPVLAIVASTIVLAVRRRA